MEVPRAALQDSKDLEDDQLEHGYGQRKGDREDQLHRNVADLVILEQLLHKEDPTAGEKKHLQLPQNCKKIHINYN